MGKTNHKGDCTMRKIRWMSLVLSLALALLCACGGDTKTQTTDSASDHMSKHENNLMLIYL